ncbi:MAG: CHAT domain-containing tetratricopeptide repeat protein [bacterium]
MKKFIVISLSLITIHCSLLTVHCQTWQEMMDSTKFYQEKQDYRTALEWAQKALLKAKDGFGELDTNYIASLVSTYLCYYYLGDTEKAIEYCEKANPIIKGVRGGNSPEYAEVLGDLGFLYDARGDYKQAELLYKEALERKRRLYKNDHPDLAQGINNMAVFYYTRVDYKKAEPMYIEALEMYRRLFKNDHPDLAQGINNIAGFYKDIGDYKQAETLFIEALEMRRGLFKGDNPELANSINSMAYFYNGRGDYKLAEPLYKEALEMYRRIFKVDHPDLAMIINNMAYFYNVVGDYKLAETLYKEALEMSRRIYIGDHPNLATSINNMAGFYKDIGDYKQAEPLFKEALEMTRHIYIDDHPDLANSIGNMAYFYQAIGDYTKAEPLYKEALEMYRRIFKGDHPDLAKTINNMAGFYNANYDYKQAEPLYKEALEVYKNMINNYFPSLSEREKKLFWSTVSKNFEDFNSFAVKRAVENPSIISNMYDIQLYSKGLLFNATSKVKKRILNSNDSILIDKYMEWTEKKNFLVKLYSMTEAERKKNNFNIDSIENLANELEKELSLKSEQFAQSYEKKKVTWRTIQGLLKPDEAAVEVVRFRYNDGKRFTDTIYYAFLIVNEQTEEHPDLVVLENGNKLENEFYNEYREKIKTRDEDMRSFSRYWEKLHEKLKGYKKIYFSADGIYNKLNPSTLLMPDGKYLLDIQDIQQLNSTKDILMGYYQTKQESNIYNSAVLIGNPNFGMVENKVREASRKMKEEQDDEKIWEPMASTRGISLSQLPGTEKEINDIDKFLKGRNWVVNSYLGDMALKTAVKTANSPRVLHIATHGLFLEDVKLESNKQFGFEEQKLVENPLLRSGLFFTGADNYLKSDSSKPSGDENGILTAYEAMSLDLDKTELVVLSACETGLGEIKNGEGVFGLRRAFQQAGAKTVVMSLWTVNDEATQELMSNFYSNWVTGMTKRDAFSKAQQIIKDKYKDPYYWGAFVMVGE